MIPGEVVAARVKELLQTPPPKLITIAALGLVWTASSFIEALRTILNRIYEIHNPPAYPLRRLISIAQLLIITALLLFGIGMLILMPKAWCYLALNLKPQLPGTINVMEEMVSCNLLTASTYHNYFGMLLFLCVLCSFLYYLIPNTKVRFKAVLPGAFLVSVLWIISGVIFTKYLTYYVQMNSVYGSLANVIITMIFFYVNNIIFIYGAELNYQLARRA